MAAETVTQAQYPTPHWLRAELDAAWGTSPGKIDWMRMERLMRDIMAAAFKGEIRHDTALFVLDAALAAFTRRGSTHSANPFA